MSLIYQTVKDRKIEESEKVRHLKKVHHYSSIDGRLDAKVFKRDGICAKKITALGNFKNEGKADNKKEMLLVWEEDDFPAKNVLVGSDLLKTDRRLLQKDPGVEGKWVKTERTIITSYWTFKVRVAKLPTSSTILIMDFLILIVDIWFIII